MKRWHIGGAVVALAATHLSSPASASGDPLPTPTYIHSWGGTPAEQQRMFAGHLGVVLPDATGRLLFVQWRLLHGLEVGAAGPPLVKRYHWVPQADDEGVTGWMAARALVTGGAASSGYLRLDKKTTEEYQYTPNCYDDALNHASATLKARVKEHGTADPGVRAWLDAQDAVFRQCSESSEVAMPALPADAPDWLRYDRAYQDAAWSLYAGKFRDSARQFAAIGRDTASPWHGMGFYLTARALYREVIDKPQADSIQLARAAIDRLAAAPPGTYGQSEAIGMRRAIDFRERPEWLFNDLERVLNEPKATTDLDLVFKDYEWLGLALKNKPRPEIADWIGTVQKGYVQGDYNDRPLVLDWLANARAHWTKSKDVAWLIAALSLVHPGDPAAAGLAADAAKVPESHPGWLTAQYHLMRITIGTVPAAETRARVDRILAHRDLPQSERNLFLSVRAQVSTGLPDFIAHSLRRPFCVATKPRFCVADDSAESDITLGKGAQGWVGFGEESRAIIDRMPLDMRIAVSRSPTLPRDMRMDIALTNFPRAVLLQDDAAIDQVARDLVALLPQMASDWQTILVTRPGESKRFATWLALAKIPGLRIDLAEYFRPSGTIRQFHGYWVEWMMVPKGAFNAPRYTSIDEYSADGRYLDGHADDPTCRGKCGAGAFPLHTPDFLANLQAQVTRERQAFAFYIPNRSYYTDAEPVFPKGTSSVWEAMFAYAKAHPNDPRSPEALYWLNRITRWGANPDHLSKRAFDLLHGRYPGSSWARRAPYHWD